MDFSAALDTRVSEVQKPKVQPQGTYVWTVTKFDISSVSSAKGDWDVIEFKIRAIKAEEDVDPEELELYGDLKLALNRVSFMFTKAGDGDNERLIAQNRLKKFLTETLRVDGSDNPDATLKELIAASPNCQFLGRAVWKVQGEDTYVELRDTMPLE